jgi:DNA replication and repair protein RecF
MLADSSYAQQVYKLRSIVDNRNALLSKRCTDRELLEPWTRALWHQSVVINTARSQAVEQLNAAVARLVKQLGLVVSVELCLSERNVLDGDLESFMSHNSNLLQQEFFCGRSLFGAHLDDILIDLNGIPARSFASRGQQKLVAFLLKSAQVIQLIKQGTKPVFVLDDIMVDFDEYHMQRVIGGVCSFDCQLILTCAQHAFQLAAMVGEQKTQHLVL